MEPMPAAVRTLVQWNLALLGAGFAWFAYIDAAITDGAMLVFASAVATSLLSVTAAVLGSAAQAERLAMRIRRAALLLFLVALALMLTAATATLNMKGSGSDAADTQTAVLMPV
jgi:hypothetical protein